jgi:4-hydroxybenzoate polyprenyltransferase
MSLGETLTPDHSLIEALRRLLRKKPLLLLALPLWALKGPSGFKSALADESLFHHGAEPSGALVWQGFRPCATTARRNVLAIARALRIHQWIKNILLFAPLVLAHQILNFELTLKALTAFAAFNCCASSVYLINDLLDLASDRAHPTKRHRPFASGELPLGIGYVAAPLLLALSLVLAFQVAQAFFLVLLLYFALTNAYSFFLKKKVLVDAVALACLYTLRILAGVAATALPVSGWLLLFSIFFFYSLALAKRATEILPLQDEPRDTGQSRGRGYYGEDFLQISIQGVVSGLLSTLVYSLYISSRDVMRLYPSPFILWFGVLLLGYWIGRVWLLVGRRQMDDDPILFAVKDPISLATGVSLLVIIYAATQRLPVEGWEFLMTH